MSSAAIPREPSRSNDTNTIFTVQETIEQLVPTVKGNITHDLKREREIRGKMFADIASVQIFVL